MTRIFTGRHMALILVAFFGVVVTVNFTMARYASSTFGGVVVENSYVASQHFNRWLDEAAVERDLGWSAEVERMADGQVRVVLAGAPADAVLTAQARHPLGKLEDVDLTFAKVADGTYTSTGTIARDRWTLRLSVRSGAHVWRSEAVL